MNVGDIVPFGDAHSIPNGAKTEVQSNGLRITTMPISELDRLVEELRETNPTHGSDRYLAEWILARFTRKDYATLVHQDGDGDKWFRNSDETYTLEGHSDDNYLFGSKSLEYVKRNFGTYTEENY